MKILTLFTAITIYFSAALMPASVLAGDNDSWQFGAGLYGWFPQVSGQTAFGDLEIDVEDVLDSLEFTVMGTLDARKGSWGMLTDFIYVNLGDSVSGTRDVTIGGNQLPVNAAASVNLDVESWVWTLAGYYRAIDRAGLTLDIVGGARFFDVEQTVSWDVTGNVGSIPAPGRTGTEKEELSNWDAILGIKGKISLGRQNKWFVPYYIDMGAGESDFTWQGIAGLGYSFGWCEIAAVWRYLYYDLSDMVIKDMSLNGPALGIMFRW